MLVPERHERLPIEDLVGVRPLQRANHPGAAVGEPCVPLPVKACGVPDPPAGFAGRDVIDRHRQKMRLQHQEGRPALRFHEWIAPWKRSVSD